MLAGARPVPSRRCCTRPQLGARQVPPSSRRLSPAKPAGQTAATAGPAPTVEPQWNDIVEYLLPQPVGGVKLGIGRVEQVADGRVTLAPLEEDDEEQVWVESHDIGSVVVSERSVVRILAYDFSQRQDKEGNPHGEHAHDVYTLLDNPSMGVYRGPQALKVVIHNKGLQE